MTRILRIMRDNFVPILAFLIIFFELWSIHYHYTGPIATLNGPDYVANSSYSFPKYSDEWVAAGMAKYSIENKTLPNANYLDGNVKYPNILVVFHSIVAVFFWVTGLDPVFNFSVLAIVSGLFICFSAYILLRSLEVTKFYSSIAILLIPFVSQGGNLTGIWFVIPFTLSLSFLFLQFASMIKGNWKSGFLFSILSLIIYPPMVVFSVPSYFGYKKDFRKVVVGIISLFSATSVVSIIVTKLVPDINIISIIIDSIFRQNLEGGMVSYPIWYVIPIFLIPLVVVGVMELYKKGNYFLLIPITVGLLYWVFYVFYPNVILIEYPRIVIATSIMLVISSGLSLHLLEKSFSKFKYFILPIFVLASFFYPIGNSWKHFVLRPFDHKFISFILPNPPIRYSLIPNDLELFKDIDGINFISPPWKGLVLGTVTNNDPLDSKSSTIGVMKLSYNVFMSSDCDQKIDYVKGYNIGFVYSGEIECQGFEKIGESPEGLRMYDVRGLNSS